MKKDFSSEFDDLIGKFNFNSEQMLTELFLYLRDAYAVGGPWCSDKENIKTTKFLAKECLNILDICLEIIVDDKIHPS